MKHFTLSRIRQVFPQFNKKPLTEADFWRVCKKFRIIVREMPLPVDGYHQRKRGRYYILIDSKLTGIKWLHTAFHELCHFLLDAPGETDNYTLYRRSHPDDEDPRESFADAFAVICIMPWPELVRLAHEDDISEHHALLQICRDRFTVKTEYGI